MSNYRATSSGKCVYRTRHLGRVVLSVAVLPIIVLAALLGLPARAQAASTRPGGNIQDPAVLSIDIARPAVVRLAESFRASLTVQLCPGKVATYSDLSQSDPPIGGLGSGAFIDSHGDILTADHVVDSSRDWLLSIAFEVYANNIAADLATECGVLETSDQVLQDPNIQFVGGSTSDLTYKMWLDSSYAGPYPATTFHDYVDFVEHSSPSYTFTVTANSFVTQNDVAIIHTNLTDTPSIPLGDINGVSPTDQLTIIGYPGNGDVTSLAATYTDLQLNLNDILTESLNRVYVSAIKTNGDNGALIQVGGNVEHGDSGGPALNAQGQLVGVVSFGGTDSPDGTSFLQASSSAEKLVSQLGLDLTPGAFETAWRQALTDYASTASGHWHKAAGELAALQRKYPQFTGVADYLAVAQQNAQNEHNTGSSASSLATNATLIIAIGSAVLIVLVVLIIFFSVSNSRRAAKQKAMAAAQEAVAVSAGSRATSGYYGYGAGYPPGSGGQYAPPQSGYPFSGYPPAGGSAPWAPAPPPPAQAADRPPASSGVCVNGHPMQPNESYCSICGAPRAQ
jgi:S1-C subfamily serine protease